jgi:pimeloyl-ACP methyl ester carboxylesterase
MKQDPKHKFHDIFSTEDLIELERKKGTSKPQDILNLADAMTKHNTLERLHEIQIDTLVLAGEKDRITPKISSDEIHKRIPNCILKVFEGGHFFPLEEAPEVNQAILEFLK